MDRRTLLALMLAASLLLAGCSGMQKCLDGSYDKEIKNLSVANQELKQNVEKLDAACKECEKTVKEQSDQISRHEADKAALSTRIRNLTEEIEKMKASAAGAEKQKEMKAEARGQEQAAPQPVRIKILAGTSQIARAKVLSAKLAEMGYKVERLDRAPRTFSRNTVFYSSDSEEAAKRIAKRMGGQTGTKPITWSSVFNIIIAVGKK